VPRRGDSVALQLQTVWVAWARWPHASEEISVFGDALPKTAVAETLGCDDPWWLSDAGQVVASSGGAFSLAALRNNSLYQVHTHNSIPATQMWSCRPSRTYVLNADGAGGT
jgi:hypothetical protein